ncbi:hypothetical protein ACFL56_02305 [Candidatus Margulisiibacteriota bacterium]
MKIPGGMLRPRMEPQSYPWQRTDLWENLPSVISIFLAMPVEEKISYLQNIVQREAPNGYTDDVSTYNYASLRYIQALTLEEKEFIFDELFDMHMYHPMEYDLLTPLRDRFSELLGFLPLIERNPDRYDFYSLPDGLSLPRDHESMDIRDIITALENQIKNIIVSDDGLFLCLCIASTLSVDPQEVPAHVSHVDISHPEFVPIDTLETALDVMAINLETYEPVFSYYGLLPLDSFDDLQKIVDTIENEFQNFDIVFSYNEHIIINRMKFEVIVHFEEQGYALTEEEALGFAYLRYFMDQCDPHMFTDEAMREGSLDTVIIGQRHFNDVVALLHESIEENDVGGFWLTRNDDIIFDATIGGYRRELLREVLFDGLQEAMIQGIGNEFGIEYLFVYYFRNVGELTDDEAALFFEYIDLYWEENCLYFIEGQLRRFFLDEPNNNFKQAVIDKVLQIMNSLSPSSDEDYQRDIFRLFSFIREIDIVDEIFVEFKDLLERNVRERFLDDRRFRSHFSYFVRVSDSHDTRKELLGLYLDTFSSEIQNLSRATDACVLPVYIMFGYCDENIIDAEIERFFGYIPPPFRAEVCYYFLIIYFSKYFDDLYDQGMTVDEVVTILRARAHDYFVPDCVTDSVFNEAFTILEGEELQSVYELVQEEQAMNEEDEQHVVYELNDVRIVNYGNIEIGDDIYEAITAVVDEYNNYVLDEYKISTIYIVETERALFDEENLSFTISTKYFSHAASVIDVARAEMAHAVEIPRTYDFLRRVYEETNRRWSYNPFWEEIYSGLRSLQGIVPVDPFEVFDESNYEMSGIIFGDSIGHPYSNIAELAAAGITLFKEHPDRFVEIITNEDNIQLKTLLLMVWAYVRDFYFGGEVFLDEDPFSEFQMELAYL